MGRSEIEEFKIADIDDFDMSNLDKVVEIMAEGDKEAEEIIRDIAAESVYYLVVLDDMNIRGEQILFALLYCNQDFETLKQALTYRDQMMIHQMNEYYNKRGSAPIAIKYGAGLKRSNLVFPPKGH